MTAKIIFIKRFNSLILLLLAMLFSKASLAKSDCSFVSGYSESKAYVNLPSVLNISRDAAPGDVLWETEYWQGDIQGTRVKCSRQYFWDDSTVIYSTGYFNSMTKVQVSGHDNVYLTTNPSIGIYTEFNNSTSDIENTVDMVSPMTEGPIELWEYIPKTRFKVKLIALSKPVSGTLNFALPTAGLKYGTLRTNSLWFTSTEVIVQTVSCKVETPIVNVHLDEILATELTGVGSVAKPKSFSIGMTCDEGVSISAKFTGKSDENTTNEQGVLALSNGDIGIADGVGIQLLYKNNPVKLNNTNKLASSAGYIELPFTAQYYQTKNLIKPGAANAVATVEILYQ
ncbi:MULTISPECIES: fimbrial protein [Enterobacterales]|uniref:fimbrial protein n=1 Tax=Enterobacterales TaxID=91347 RepID=UPI002ED78406